MSVATHCHELALSNGAKVILEVTEAADTVYITARAAGGTVPVADTARLQDEIARIMQPLAKGARDIDVSAPHGQFRLRTITPGVFEIVSQQHGLN